METRRHGRVCVGPCSSENHPLFRYKVLALESGLADVYAVLMIGLELMVCHYLVDVHDVNNGSGSGFIHEVLKRGSHSDVQEEDIYGVRYSKCLGDCYGEDIQNIVMESHRLLLEILEDRSDFGTAIPDNDDGTDVNAMIMTSLDSWEALLAYVNRNRIMLNVPSALAEWCSRITDSDGWCDDHVLIQEANFNLEEEGEADTVRYISSEDSDAGSSDSVGDSDDAPSAPVDAVHLMDEPAFYFPPHSCTALFQRTYTNSHSCIPTHSLRYINVGRNYIGNAHSALHAQLYPIKESDGGMRAMDTTTDKDTTLANVTVSLIDNTLDLEGRVEQLAQRGMGKCHCYRCVFERWQEGDRCQADSRSPCNPSELLCLLSLAKCNERYEDALQVCEVMLQINPTDPQALMERARISGWLGDFSRRETLLLEAAGVSDDECIRVALEEAHAYYCNSSW
eukprot:CAMPEP_0181125260 /NCGR_PEP_ID=MMETSP1071-20121207/26941_1 /TAXON_ID=35127 /ORGANISM="Thalassiosira sp., Strain NH16" /LENGTH=451 /DNA_ID=CAMNT_0023210663 /DNA_START=103 /DNA_END=1455 /DNA_ORIENTATION=+